MDAINEMTALNASVGAEAGQPFTKSNTTIINDNDSDFNRFDEINDLCDIDESYLHTVSMTELFDSAYQSKPPIIDGLLYRGTYLFAGSPKIGKSFLMAQLALVLDELKRIEAGAGVDDELLDNIRLITVTLNGMKEECEWTP